MQKFLIVGLGNPGQKFQNTRHNLGIQIVRRWFDQTSPAADHVEDWRDQSRYLANIATLTLNQTHVTCLFPLTYMNKSGRALSAFVRARWFGLQAGFPTNQILIVHDDTDLPLGVPKLKPSGSARGHNGIKSIHQSLGTKDIKRLLIGIGKPDNQPLDKHVLGKFTPAEQKIIDQSTPAILQSITTLVTQNK